MFKIRSDSNIPLYEQIITSVKTAIFNGSLQEGEKLPSVRELAEFTGVNPNTISKAYSYLEREHIITKQKGKGTFVSENIPRRSDDILINDAKEQLQKIIMDLYHMGIDKDGVIHMINQLYDNILKEDAHA